MKDIELQYQELSRQEIQVALAVRYFRKRKLETAEYELSKFCYETFGKYLVDFQSGLQLLQNKGIVVTDNGKISAGKNKLDLLNYIQQAHPICIYFYNDFFERVENSMAFAEFAVQLFGRNLCQQGQMDMEQLTILLDQLGINSKQQVLEIGCGNGYVTEYIQKTTGCRIKGVDISDIAVNKARLRTAAVPEMEFEIKNLNLLNDLSGKFDRIISIDTLYLASDLELAISAIIRLLKPKGKIGIFWESWIKNEHDTSLIQEENTKLGKILRKQNICYKVCDLSEANNKHWHERRRILQIFKNDFLTEGNLKLYNSLLDETNRLETSTGARYLYIIER